MSKLPQGKPRSIKPFGGSNKRLLALAAATGASTIYGINHTLAKGVMPTYIGAYGFILLRVLGASLLFWLLSMFTKSEQIDRADYWRFLGCAVFGMFVNMLSFFKGLSLSTPINSSVIITLSPVILLILSALFLKERIGFIKILGVLIGMLGALVLVLFGAAVLELWGIKIGPIIAGLGLFGVAVALGAQDLFKNLISGILVLVERRFQVGDWIFVEDVIEGTVESIGFRSTVVRRFDKSLATIPNFQFAEKAVINNSQITNRRINWIIGLEYRTTSKQLTDIKKEIEEYIKNSEHFTTSGNTILSVKIDQFAASSIDIKLICFTKTRHYLEWMKVKDILAVEIKNIVEKHKASFAFPSTSIYVEKN